MPVQPFIPPEWTWAYDIAVGQDWPQADEDALRRLAQAWTDAMKSLLTVADGGNVAAQNVNYSVQSVSSDEFNNYWSTYVDGDNSVVGQMAQQCEGLATQLLAFAEQTEFTKLSIDIQLILLVIQLIFDLVMAVVTFGASTAEGVVAAFITRLTVRSFLGELLKAVIMAVIPDVITQMVMLSEGHRSSFDVGETLQAAQMGLIGGVAGGLVGKLPIGNVLGSVAGKMIGEDAGKVLAEDAGKTLGAKVAKFGTEAVTTALHGGLTNVGTNLAAGGIDQVENQIHAALDPNYAKQLQQQTQDQGTADQKSGQNPLIAFANGAFTGLLFHGVHEGGTALAENTFGAQHLSLTVTDDNGSQQPQKFIALPMRDGSGTNYALFDEGHQFAGNGTMGDNGAITVTPRNGDPYTGQVTTLGDQNFAPAGTQTAAPGTTELTSADPSLLALGGNSHDGTPSPAPEEAGTNQPPQSVPQPVQPLVDSQPTQSPGPAVQFSVENGPAQPVENLPPQPLVSEQNAVIPGPDLSQAPSAQVVQDGLTSQVPPDAQTVGDQSPVAGLPGPIFPAIEPQSPPTSELAGYPAPPPTPDLAESEPANLQSYENAKPATGYAAAPGSAGGESDWVGEPALLAEQPAGDPAQQSPAPLSPQELTNIVNTPTQLLSSGEVRVFTNDREALRYAIQTWRGAIDQLTPEQRAALRAYTSDRAAGMPGRPGYLGINGFLIGKTAVTPEILASIRDIDEALLWQPVPENLVVNRSTNGHAFLGRDGLPIENDNLEALENLVGTVHKSPRYLSTYFGPYQPTVAERVALHLQVQAWTPGLFLEEISRTPDEHELLLARGLSFQIDRVWADEPDELGYKTWHVQAHTIEDPSPPGPGSAGLGLASAPHSETEFIPWMESQPTQPLLEYHGLTPDQITGHEVTGEEFGSGSAQTQQIGQELADRFGNAPRSTEPGGQTQEVAAELNARGLSQADAITAWKAFYVSATDDGPGLAYRYLNGDVVIGAASPADKEWIVIDTSGVSEPLRMTSSEVGDWTLGDNQPGNGDALGLGPSALAAEAGPGGLPRGSDPLVSEGQMTTADQVTSQQAELGQQPVSPVIEGLRVTLVHAGDPVPGSEHESAGSGPEHESAGTGFEPGPGHGTGPEHAAAQAHAGSGHHAGEQPAVHEPVRYAEIRSKTWEVDHWRVEISDGERTTFMRVDQDQEAGRVVFSSFDDNGATLSQMASFVKTPTGMFDVFSHADENGLLIDGMHVSFDKMADYLPELPDEAVIRLNGCRAGHGDALQELANATGHAVLAADSTVWIDKYGNVFAAGSHEEDGQARPTINPDGTTDGHWKLFRPNAPSIDLGPDPRPLSHVPESGEPLLRLKNGGWEPGKAEQELANRVPRITADKFVEITHEGASEPYVITYDDQRAVFKPEVKLNLEGRMRAWLGDELYSQTWAEASLWNKVSPDELRYPRELAAYSTDQMLGFGLVPTTAKASFDIPGVDGVGSLQQFVAGGPSKPANAYEPLDQQRMAVLDYVTGNSDRHGNNYMTGRDGRPAAIDHGEAFPATEFHQDGEPWTIWSNFVSLWKDRPLDPQVLDQVRTVDLIEFEEMLRARGISEPAVQQAVARLTEIQDNGKITGEAFSGDYWPPEHHVIEERELEGAKPNSTELGEYAGRMHRQTAKGFNELAIAFRAGEAGQRGHLILIEGSHDTVGLPRGFEDQGYRIIWHTQQGDRPSATDIAAAKAAGHPYELVTEHYTDPTTKAIVTRTKLFLPDPNQDQISYPKGGVQAHPLTHMIDELLAHLPDGPPGPEAGSQQHNAPESDGSQDSAGVFEDISPRLRGPDQSGYQVHEPGTPAAPNLSSQIPAAQQGLNPEQPQHTELAAALSQDAERPAGSRQDSPLADPTAEPPAAEASPETMPRAGEQLEPAQHLASDLSKEPGNAGGPAGPPNRVTRPLADAAPQEPFRLTAHAGHYTGLNPDLLRTVHLATEPALRYSDVFANPADITPAHWEEWLRDLSSLMTLRDPATGAYTEWALALHQSDEGWRPVVYRGDLARVELPGDALLLIHSHIMGSPEGQVPSPADWAYVRTRGLSHSYVLVYSASDAAPDANRMRILRIGYEGPPSDLPVTKQIKGHWWPALIEEVFPQDLRVPEPANVYIFSQQRAEQAREAIAAGSNITRSAIAELDAPSGGFAGIFGRVAVPEGLEALRGALARVSASVDNPAQAEAAMAELGRFTNPDQRLWPPARQELRAALSHALAAFYNAERQTRISLVRDDPATQAAAEDVLNYVRSLRFGTSAGRLVDYAVASDRLMDTSVGATADPVDKARLDSTRYSTMLANLTSRVVDSATLHLPDTPELARLRSVLNGGAVPDTVASRLVADVQANGFGSLDAARQAQFHALLHVLGAWHGYLADDTTLPIRNAVVRGWVPEEDHFLVELFDGERASLMRLDRVGSGFVFSSLGSDGDLLRQMAAAVPADDGVANVFGHADAEGILIGRTRIPFAELGSKLLGFPEGSAIRLYGCDAGTGTHIDELARVTGRTVVAADTPVWVDRNGNVIASSEIYADGQVRPYIGPNGRGNGTWRFVDPDGRKGVLRPGDLLYPPAPGLERPLSHEFLKLSEPGNADRPAEDDVTSASSVAEAATVGPFGMFDRSSIFGPRSASELHLSDAVQAFAGPNPFITASEADQPATPTEYLPYDAEKLADFNNQFHNIAEDVTGDGIRRFRSFFGSGAPGTGGSYESALDEQLHAKAVVEAFRTDNPELGTKAMKRGIRHAEDRFRDFVHPLVEAAIMHDNVNIFPPVRQRGELDAVLLKGIPVDIMYVKQGTYEAPDPGFTWIRFPRGGHYPEIKANIDGYRRDFIARGGPPGDFDRRYAAGMLNLLRGAGAAVDENAGSESAVPPWINQHTADIFSLAADIYGTEKYNEFAARYARGNIDAFSETDVGRFVRECASLAVCNIVLEGARHPENLFIGLMTWSSLADRNINLSLDDAIGYFNLMGPGRSGSIADHLDFRTDHYDSLLDDPRSTRSAKDNRAPKYRDDWIASPPRRYVAGVPEPDKSMPGAIEEIRRRTREIAGVYAESHGLLGELRGAFPGPDPMREVIHDLHDPLTREMRREFIKAMTAAAKEAMSKRGLALPSESASDQDLHEQLAAALGAISTATSDPAAGIGETPGELTDAILDALPPGTSDPGKPRSLTAGEASALAQAGDELSRVLSDAFDSPPSRLLEALHTALRTRLTTILTEVDSGQSAWPAAKARLPEILRETLASTEVQDKMTAMEPALLKDTLQRLMSSRGRRGLFMDTLSEAAEEVRRASPRRAIQEKAVQHLFHELFQEMRWTSDKRPWNELVQSGQPLPSQQLLADLWVG